jgi:hypothetical protein
MLGRKAGQQAKAAGPCANRAQQTGGSEVADARQRLAGGGGAATR